MLPRGRKRPRCEEGDVVVDRVAQGKCCLDSCVEEYNWLEDHDVVEVVGDGFCFFTVYVRD